MIQDIFALFAAQNQETDQKMILDDFLIFNPKFKKLLKLDCQIAIYKF